MLHAAGHGVDFAADTPVEFLYLCTRIQVDDAMAEKVECLFALSLIHISAAAKLPNRHTIAITRIFFINAGV